MVVASLLLILAAAVLLVLGLVQDLDLLLVVSIAVSLLAAVVLYVGARPSRSKSSDTAAGGGRAAAVPPAAEQRPTAPRHDEQSAMMALRPPPEHGERVPPIDRREPAGRPDWPVERAVPPRDDATLGAGRYVPQWSDPYEQRRAGDPYGEAAAGGSGERDDEDPLDEPPVQRTPRSDAGLVARLPAEVLVVDGRPRYHMTGCRHLRGREAEPLPVAEAVELGFTPCGWCQPDTVLLGGTPDR